MSLIVTGVVGGLGAAAGLYESSQSNKISQQGLNIAQGQRAEQEQYNQQLQQLISDPTSFLSNPLFKSTLNLGLGAAQRSMSAQGLGESGNELAELEQYGQSFASGQLMSQEQLLAGLTGLNVNPASSLSAATGAQGQSASELSGGMNTAALMALLLQGQGGAGGFNLDTGLLNPTLTNPGMGVINQSFGSL